VYVYGNLWARVLPGLLAVVVMAPAHAALDRAPKDVFSPPRAASPFTLDRSCGYLYESPADARFATCERPVKDRMPRLITSVRRAAERDSAYDQFVLGMAHWQGDRAPQDPVRALMWLNLAAEKALEVAVFARDALSRQLSIDEVVEADRLTRQWRQRHDTAR
jgi:hypothetical protein